VRVRWRLSALLVTGVLAVGWAGTAVLATAVDHQHRDHAAEVMDQRVQVVESAVSAEVRRYTETTTDLAAAIGAQSDLGASDFRTLTSTLNRDRLPGISGASLVVAATDGQVPQLQRRWRARGNHGLVLDPNAVRGEHLFGVLSHPLDGTPPLTGRDVTTAAEPTQALLAARRLNEVRASPTYVLLKDRALPATQQQLSFVLAAPIRGGAGTPDAGRFRGWLVMGLRGSDFINQTMQGASQNTVAVTLLDTAGPTGAPVPVARAGHGRILDQPRLLRKVDIPVAGRTWQLQVRPTAKFAAIIGPSLRAPTGTVGFVGTLLLAVLVGTLSTSRNRALTRVDNATAALRADIERREQVEAALREREEQLHVMALTDSLTGLANRRAFMDQLDQSHARAARHLSPVCVLFGDVDQFKAINDTYGHAAGDAVLGQVADRLRGHFRVGDTVGRLGGDEFAVICEDGSSFTQVLLDRLRDVLSAPYSFRGESILATVSVGMASPQPGETSAQLLERADTTMYLAKKRRTNQVVI
jgi:diguanylate cyclase (GGDEF)-like protein